MFIHTRRFTLRDFQEDDRNAFVSYQMDILYRALYDFDEDPGRAHELFDLFHRWRSEEPRHNFQLGIFDRTKSELLGCAGLRVRPEEPGVAVLGLELAPPVWGRHRLALDVAACLVEHGFNDLGLQRLVGDTASGNDRVTKLARWLGAGIVARRDGPEWMHERGWQEVDWALSRIDWTASDKRANLLCRLAGGP